MSPERLEEFFGDLVWTHDFSAQTRSGAMDSLAALMLGGRMAIDPAVRRLVEELTGLSPEKRGTRAAEMAAWIPRGYGRRVVVELLLRAARDGHGVLAHPVAIACLPDAPPQPGQAQRKPKQGEKHEKVRTYALEADRAVRRLVPEPAALGPDTRNHDAAEKSLRTFLQEAAASILRRGEIDRPGARALPRHPSRERRHAA